MPKISIIVPVFNSEDIVDRCIESILNQTYSDFELILINDGSTDSSLKTLKKYEKKDIRIRVIDNKNKGVSETRNEGVKLAVGEYIQFIDSDDEIQLNMLEETLSKINSYDLIVTGINIKVINKEKIDISKQTFKNEILTNKHDIARGVLERLDGTCIHSPCNKLYRRDIIIENNLYMDKNISLGEDLIFNLEYLKNCEKVIFDSNCYYNYYLKSNESLTAKYRADKLELMYLLYLKCKDYLVSSKIDNEELRLLNTLFIKWIYSALNDLNHPRCKMKLKEKVNYIKKIKTDYYKIINNTSKLNIMFSILKLGIRIPVIALLLSKTIFCIKTKFRQIFYRG